MIKKLSIIVALVVLISSMTLTAFAAKASLTVSNSSPNAGETITVTVSLSGCSDVNTLGVSVDYDKSKLELTSDSKWLISGFLTNIDLDGGKGVYASEEDSVDVNTNIISLAFKVKDTDYDSSKISVEVIVKSDSETLATLNEKISLTAPHTHVFDQKVTSDSYLSSNATCEAKASYYYSCTCGEAGSETFETGDLAEHTMDNNTCSVCGYTVEVEPDVEAEPDVTDTTEPEADSDDAVGETEEDNSEVDTETEDPEAPADEETESDEAPDADIESEADETPDVSSDAPASTDSDDGFNPVPVVIAAVVALAAAGIITVIITKKKK